jgi:regulator of replication initiation timing
MTKEEFLNSITEIGSCEDIVEVRSKLTELSNSVTDIYDSNSELSQDNERLTQDNEKLRSANMDLFLQVGGKHKAEDIIDTEPPKPQRIEKSFEELFNEK